MNRITASAETLLRQASMTATTYLTEAVHEIDARFGKGYAAKNPALVGVFMQVAASDFNSLMATQAYQDRTAAMRGDVRDEDE